MQTAQEPHTTYRWCEMSSDDEYDIISHVIQIHDIHNHHPSYIENMFILPPMNMQDDESPSRPVESA
jgi:hypothetical protein